MKCKIPVFPAFFVGMRRFILVAAAVSPFLAVFAGCGGAGAGSAPAKEVTPADTHMEKDREPGSIEEAKRQLDQARAQLEAPATAHVEAVQPTSTGGGGGTSPRPQPPTTQENECARLCRAFASMQRAQAALCRMAGDEDAQCAEAKKVVEDSAKRVAHCGCR